MRKSFLLIGSLMIVSIIVLAGCGSDDSNNNSSSDSNTNPAVEQDNAMGDVETGSDVKTDSSCERFTSEISIENCYYGVAMDEGDPAYCENITSSNSFKQECIDSANGESFGGIYDEPNDDGFDDDNEVGGVGDYADNGGATWEDMPGITPEFVYGELVSVETGLGSYIADYQSTTSDALDMYTADLNASGWNVSSIAVTGQITGTYGTEYSIAVSIDPDYNTAQIIVTETN
jgi:hypothetical protein